METDGEGEWAGQPGQLQTNDTASELSLVRLLALSTDEGQLATGKAGSQDEKRDTPLRGLTAVEHRRSVDRLTSHHRGGKRGHGGDEFTTSRPQIAFR